MSLTLLNLCDIKIEPFTGDKNDIFYSVTTKTNQTYTDDEKSDKQKILSDIQKVDYPYWVIARTIKTKPPKTYLIHSFYLGKWFLENEN